MHLVTPRRLLIALGVVFLGLAIASYLSHTFSSLAALVIFLGIVLADFWLIYIIVLPRQYGSVKYRKIIALGCVGLVSFLLFIKKNVSLSIEKYLLNYLAENIF